MKQKLIEATENSRKYNTIMHVDCHIDNIDEALDMLIDIATDYDYDWVDNGDCWEFWAYDADAEPGEMIWRVHLDITE